MTRYNLKPLLAALLAFTMITSVVAAPAAAVTVTEPNYSSDLVGDKFIEEDRLDIASWNASEMDSPMMAYDDSGEARSLPIEWNESDDAVDNHIAYSLDNVEFDDFAQFPRKGEEDNSASALDASEWTTDASGTAGSGSVADAEAGTNVDTVQISTSSQTSGDVFVASYDNVSITTDAEKRVGMVGVNVVSIESGTEGTVSFVDSDGDTKELYINSSMAAGDDDVIANQTGDGFFTQEKLADLSTQGSGDGSFDDIETVNVSIEDGNADLNFYAFDADRKAEIAFGDQLVDTDDDDELETETIYEVTSPGEITINSMDSLPSIFDDAVIHDLGLIDVRWTASQLDAEDQQLTISDAEDYGGYATQGEFFTRLELYAWIDLTHHNPVLKVEQPMVSDRYKAYGYVEDAGDTEFEDLESFTDVTLSGQGELATVDDTIQPGKTYVLRNLVVYQDGEASNIDANAAQTAESGGGGFWSTGNPVTGFVNWAIAGMAGIMATILGVLRLGGE